jgi:MFS family permease
LFALSLLLLFTIRIHPLPPQGDEPRIGTETDTGAWQELAEGLRYVRQHRLIRVLVLASVIIELGSVGPLNVGLVLLANARSWGASGAGWVIGAFSIGAGASALLLTAVGRVPRPGVFHITTLAAGSSSIATFALAPTLPTACALGAFGGLMLGLNGGLTYALVQAATESAYLGRVMSLLSLASFGVGPLVYPVFGAAVARFGTAPVFAASGGICALGALACLLSTDVRRAELPG